MSEKQFDNEKRFTLFSNDKGGNDKRPDRRGTMQLNGVKYKLSGWIKASKKDGSPYLSGTIEIDDRDDKAAANPKPAQATTDVPF